MITIILKNGESKAFNLKSFKREKSLKDAWWAMHDDPIYESRRFKINTQAGDSFDIKLEDIESMEQSDAEYYRISPDEIYSDSHPMPKKGRDRKGTQADLKVNAFMDALLKRGIYPNYSDPFFLRILQKVSKTENLAKIRMLANMYINHITSKGVVR